ncbi:MAG: hypothetical protein J0M17_26265, partial [Planctomycetes bacterium]|nr:hypothetical protein [Planctomycetota bacterium]
MSGGSIARGGFRYQDYYLLLRVLKTIAREVERAMSSGLAPSTTILGNIKTKFGIEARSGSSAAVASDDETRDWDVVVEEGKTLELVEVKSGKVSKPDRLVFWERIRREFAAPTGNSSEVHPRLVVNPDKIDDLQRWSSLAAEAKTFKGKIPKRTPSGNVTETKDMLKEALWHLCSRSVPGLPAMSSDIALVTLSRFAVETHKAADLDLKVTEALEMFFPGALSDLNKSFLLDWMNSRAVSHPARRMFTVSEMLVDLKILALALAFQAGTLDRWQQLWEELPRVLRARTRNTLGRTGLNIPTKESQADALKDASLQPTLILGHGGSGKTVILDELGRDADQAGHLVFRCGAGDVSNAAEANDVADMLRFMNGLNLLNRPTRAFFVFVDALDEAELLLRHRWAELLGRLAARLPNVRIATSMRESAFHRDSKIQLQLGAWRRISLAEWPADLVQRLLAAKSISVSTDVLQLLRTPIMLDLFWRTFVENKAAQPDRIGKLRTRYDLLAAFWTERVLRARNGNIPNLSAKLHNWALRIAAQLGSFTPDLADDVVTQILLDEGVLAEEGQVVRRVAFRHPLLRDFAFAIACLDAPDAETAAKRWSSIAGQIQRHGALRGIAEALLEKNASAEFGKFTFDDFIGAVLSVRSDSGFNI